MRIASIGIDLGKTTFHLVALGERSKVLVRKKFSRAQLLAYTAKLPSSLIGLEACAGAHFLGAALREQGHQVRLIAGQFVKPYRKSNKNDFLDAEAIAEAVSKQNMRFVPIKTEEQLDVQATHRVRDRLVQRRTALINEIRGFLLERGIIFAAKPIHLRKHLPAVMEDAEQSLSPRLRWLLERMWQEWKQLEMDIQAITDELERISHDNALCRRLRQIPGFGPLVSTATVAAIGNGAAFRRGRDFAAWVGVVPRQYSTGGKQRLFGISKRGNVYLRRMLIHGARAVLLRVKYDTGGFGQWVHRLAQRAPRNKVVVAIANKLARIAWAVLSSGRDYRHQPLLPVAA
ncbi:MAG TPA: IS110 family transposase [Terriglobales bacterium]|nr:IS110 family transposase [Terriglobales bacterium]